MIDLDKFENFTPGPWIGVSRSLPKKGQKHEIRQNKAGAWIVGEVNFPRDMELIAAAPDLLALAKQQRDEIARLRQALTYISDIEDRLTGGDWDEINEARDIAKRALEQSHA